MAIEVRAQAFRFLNIKDTSFKVKRSDYGDAIGFNDFGYETRRVIQQPARSHTWFYNPLHDMESIFWLLLYFIANKDIFLGDPVPIAEPYIFSPETEEEYRHRILEHWNFGLTLFAGREGRKDVMGFDGTLRDQLARNPLHPAIAPLAGIIVQIRDALAGTYQRIEHNPATIDHNSGKEVHQAFATLLRDAGAHLRAVPFNVQVRSLRGAVEQLPKSSSTTHTSIGSKRLRDGQEEHGRQPKTLRTSVEHKSPSCAASADVQPDKLITKTEPVAPLPTRVLRSHSRKAAANSEAKMPPLPPPPAARARKASAPKPRKGKATKNHEAAKAAAQTASTKVKSKTRKGR